MLLLIATVISASAGLSVDINEVMSVDAIVAYGPYLAGAYNLSYHVEWHSTPLNDSVTMNVMIAYGDNPDAAIADLSTIGAKNAADLDADLIDFSDAFYLIIQSVADVSPSSRDAEVDSENVTSIVTGTLTLDSIIDTTTPLGAWVYAVIVVGGVIVMIIGSCLIILGCKKCGKKVQQSASPLKHY